MMNRVNLITLGVRDIKRSLEFYRDGLGFRTTADDQRPEIVFFQNDGTKLALYPLDALAAEVGKENDASGFSGITLAYNGKSAAEVDQIIARAEKAGSQIVKPAENAFWGGYSGYFADPDGHLWEVAYADFWRFDEHNMLIID